MESLYPRYRAAGQRYQAGKSLSRRIAFGAMAKIVSSAPPSVYRAFGQALLSRMRERRRGQLGIREPG